MQDIFGKALLDYYHGNYSEHIITETNISEEDELSLPYLFRNYAEMPAMEQKALDLSKGKVLDVGCGAGSHSLYLQKKEIDITAIDISEGAVKVTQLRGVKDVRNSNVLDICGEKFDTILLLMNGTGIFEKVASVSKYLQHLKTLLTTNGQIFIDSSDLKYMYDKSDEGGIWVPSNRYYGELDFKLKYKGEESESFPILYMDEALFERSCVENKMTFELITRGDHFDYLVRLTTAEHTLS
ncbi:MAG: methyltransferase domain-containing protein [Bacteroidetes bacterium]|nr:MAG: methyltransferase domain-containing protein [Bacteroidota bacterium]